MCGNDKTPLVLFSGGFDSTYLLYDSLLKHRKVDVLCGSMTHHEHVNNREKKAMDAIITELGRLRKESDLELGKIEYRGETEISGIQRSLLRLGQTAPWMASALSHVKHGNSEVQIGYVKGDDQIYSFHHIQNAWASSSLLGSLVDHKDLIPLIAPLALWSKGDILMAYPPTLLPLVTWCENLDEEDDCGTCASCRRMTKEIVGHFAFDKKGFKAHPIYPRIKKMIRNYKKTVISKETLL